MKNQYTLTLDPKQVEIFKSNPSGFKLSTVLNDKLIAFNKGSGFDTQSILNSIVLNYQASNISYYDALYQITILSNHTNIVFISEAIDSITKIKNDILSNSK